MAKMPWLGLYHQSQIVVPPDVKNQYRYKELMVSFHKICHHNRQQSYPTRQRYYQPMKNFVKYLADKNLGKLRNISNRHLVEYIKTMQDRGLAASTINTALSAIRFWHNQIADPRHQLASNSQLKEKYAITLEKRKFGGVDRAWKKVEFKGFCDIAEARGRTDIRLMAEIARHHGLRIHEVVRMDRAQAETALRTGELHVKGKNGKERDAKIRPEVRKALEEAIARVGRGQKLFVPQNKNAKQIIKSVQNFIGRHRDKVRDPNSADANLTAHGWRHSYAREQYWARIDAGMPILQAQLEVSQLLGHNREDVTMIYIFGEREE